MPDGSFYGALSHHPSGWAHAVINYIGPNDGQGITIYHDGRLLENDTTKFNNTYSPTNGEIAIGRVNFGGQLFYGLVEVDELLFYNRVLTDAEIILLSQT